MQITKKHKKTLDREVKIVSFCNNEKKHIDEIIQYLDNININTLRSKYLYPLVRSGKLIKYPGRWYLANNYNEEKKVRL